MDWKHRLSRDGTKSSTGGRSQAWSRSVLFCFAVEISWLSFSRTSDSKALLGWLEASLLFLPLFCELRKLAAWASGEDVGKVSVLRFFTEDGVDGGTFCRLRDSPSTRFWGRTEAMMGRL